MQHTTSLVSLAVLGSASLLKSTHSDKELIDTSSEEFINNWRPQRFIDTETGILYPEDWDRDLLFTFDGFELNQGCIDFADEWTKYCHNAQGENNWFMKLSYNGSCNYKQDMHRIMCERAECAFATCIEQRDDYIERCAYNSTAYYSLYGDRELRNYLGEERKRISYSGIQSEEV